MRYQGALFLLVFLPLVLLAYKLTPRRGRWCVLLLASYIFFFSISGKLLLWLILSTACMFACGMWLETVRRDGADAASKLAGEEKKAQKKKTDRALRGIVACGVILQIGTLLCLKYLGFFASNLNILLGKIGLGLQLPVFRFLLPIGISFYTLQAVSYLVDVYRGTVRADRNPFRLALYMSFFPGLMEGPIARYSDTAQSLYDGAPLTYRNLTFGVQRMVFGLFKKIVIADRLNIAVKEIFEHYDTHTGTVILLGAVLYTCQLYADFSGIMDMGIGIGEMFGVRMPENFRRPFFSKSISEFWTRWHITLGAWFRDYLYYPLSLSAPMKKLTARCRRRFGNRQAALITATLSLFCVWLCNGLWHGAAWSYLFFGMYHFFFIALANITEPLTGKLLARLHIPTESAPWRLFRILRTCLLVCIGELFFRAATLTDGLRMFGRIVTDFRLPTELSLGLDRHDVVLLAVAVLIVLLVSILGERGVDLRQRLAEKPLALRWGVYYTALLAVIFFGAYGTGYIPVDPMYAAF